MITTTYDSQKFYTANKNIISSVDQIQNPQQIPHHLQIYTKKVTFFSSIFKHGSQLHHYIKVAPKGLLVCGCALLLTGNAPNPESINGFCWAIIRLCCGFCWYAVGGWYGPNGLAWYCVIWAGGAGWYGVIWPDGADMLNGSDTSNGLGAGDPYTGCWEALYAPSSYKLLSVSESNPPACHQQKSSDYKKYE